MNCQPIEEEILFEGIAMPLTDEIEVGDTTFEYFNVILSSPPTVEDILQNGNLTQTSRRPIDSVTEQLPSLDHPRNENHHS
jgi:hypothetical protein